MRIPLVVRQCVACLCFKVPYDSKYDKTHSYNGRSHYLYNGYYVATVDWLNQTIYFTAEAMRDKQSCKRVQALLDVFFFNANVVNHNGNYVIQISNDIYDFNKPTKFNYDGLMI